MTVAAEQDRLLEIGTTQIRVAERGPWQVGAAEQCELEVGAGQERSPKVGVEQLQAAHQFCHVLSRADEVAVHVPDVATSWDRTPRLRWGRPVV